MSIEYKIDVLATLKEKGYSTYKLRKEKIFGEGTLQAFRTSGMVSIDTLNSLCKLLGCQPGDIISYREDAPEGDN